MNFKSQLNYFLIIAFMYIGLPSCNHGFDDYKISITNQSELVRVSKTVEVNLDQLPGFSVDKVNYLCVKDESGNTVLTQLIDLDSDSIADQLIFQCNLAANGTKVFTIVQKALKKKNSEHSIKTFCRFVPERMDDFAWENDKVAFRSYGPECQKLFEGGNRAGLISSGIDCWLKRVEYPIIDKWYTKNSNGGSYHIDEGEGLDNYHVGTSRGCGGTAILHEGEYVLSENFTTWNIIANGPIRSVFELEYPSLKVDGQDVTEKKTITIDLSSNFYHCKVEYQSENSLTEAAIGIIHHNTEGEISFEKNEKFLSYWETLDDSYLGTAILIDKKGMADSEVNNNKDADNIWLNISLKKNSFSYWSGFGWKKAGEFSSAQDWNNYLLKQAQLNNSPLSITIEKI